MPFAETVVEIAESVASSVHRAALAVRRVHPGAEPFEIAALAAVYFYVEERRRWIAPRAFGGAFDSVGQGIGSLYSERRVNRSQVLAVERIKLRIVGGGMLRPVPPIPIASFGSEYGVIGKREPRAARP